MIVVTVQYRLGLFGWLRYSRYGFEGNYGLRDLIMALRSFSFFPSHDRSLQNADATLPRLQRSYTMISRRSEEILHVSLLLVNLPELK